MLRLINPPPLAANLSQVFMLLYALHVTYCRSQDYRPPFPQQGMNQSLLERHISSPTTAASPQLIPAHKFSPRVPAEVTNPCWGSPIPSSPVTFHQHMLRLSPSPLIVKNTSSPFLVQPIASRCPSTTNIHLGHRSIFWPTNRYSKKPCSAIVALSFENANIGNHSSKSSSLLLCGENSAGVNKSTFKYGKPHI